EAFRRWFAIDVTPEKEYSRRLAPAELRCLTPEAVRDLQPRPLGELLGELADERVAQARARREGGPPAEQRPPLAARRGPVRGGGGGGGAGGGRAGRVGVESVDGVKVERVLVTVEPGVVVPLLLLVPQKPGGRKPPVTVAVCQAGKAALLRERASDLAALLTAGVAVCLPDVRGTGASVRGGGRGRTGAATAISSGLMMLGDTLVGAQLRDLRAVLAWLRRHDELDAARPALWGDSLAPVNPPQANLAVPRDDDA